MSSSCAAAFFYNISREMKWNDEMERSRVKAWWNQLTRSRDRNWRFMLVSLSPACFFQYPERRLANDKSSSSLPNPVLLAPLLTKRFSSPIPSVMPWTRCEKVKNVSLSLMDFLCFAKAPRHLFWISFSPPHCRPSAIDNEKIFILLCSWGLVPLYFS